MGNLCVKTFKNTLLHYEHTTVETEESLYKNHFLIPASYLSLWLKLSTESWGALANFRSISMMGTFFNFKVMSMMGKLFKPKFI